MHALVSISLCALARVTSRAILPLFAHQTIANIREALKKSKRMCAIMLDTKGPEIRTGLLKDGKDVEIVEGQVSCNSRLSQAPFVTS